MNQFTNPYLKETPAFNGKGKNLYRVITSIDKNDYEFICSLRPTKGTGTTVQNILWQKIVLALKTYGITDISQQSDFESFIANCTITDGRSRTPAGGDASQDSVGNDRRGTEGVRTESTKSTNIKPVASRRVGKKAHEGRRETGKQT